MNLCNVVWVNIVKKKNHVQVTFHPKVKKK